MISVKRSAWIIFLALILRMTQAGNCASTGARDIENEGIALIMQGKIEDGLELMKRSTRLEPNNPIRHMNYASILMAKGRSQLETGLVAEGNMTLKEAEGHLLIAAKYLKNTPPEMLSKSQCYALLGDIYLYAFGQTEKALGFYRQSLNADPANASVKNILESLEQ